MIHVKLGPVLQDGQRALQVRAHRLNGQEVTAFVPTSQVEFTTEGAPARRFAWVPRWLLERDGLREWQEPQPLSTGTRQ